MIKRETQKKDASKLFWYLAILAVELLIIHNLSDLPVLIGNWLNKSKEIASLNIPSENFYGPGAALLMTPFLWLENELFIIVLLYFIGGAIAFWKICNFLDNKSFRFIAKASLPLNLYLLWLINSSQDTVFEFFLLLWGVYFLVKKQYVKFTIFIFILCCTRAGYWTFFLGSSLILLIIDLKKFKKLYLKKILAVPLLILISVFNFVNYGSSSPALEGGITAYFSYSKYHYLSLPKMDMDVFLSGPNGIFSSKYGESLEKYESGNQANSDLFKAAIRSALSNKKETLLGWMQKVDSYIFDVQKIPHLPGRYVLNLETKNIQIENERLNWIFVLGNFFYFISRVVLVLLVLSALGVLVSYKSIFSKSEPFVSKYWQLSLPYILGFIPGILFYTETRFKIVSELLLVPLILGIWSTIYGLRKSHFEKINEI